MELTVHLRDIPSTRLVLNNEFFGLAKLPYRNYFQTLVIISNSFKNGRFLLFKTKFIENNRNFLQISNIYIYKKDYKLLNIDNS